LRRANCISLDEIIPPNDDDDTFVKALEELDARIDFGEEYGDWESDFFEIKDLCCERMITGCKPRGSRDMSDQFSACIEPYLNFIYQYDAGDLLMFCLLPLKSFSWIG